MSQVVLGFWTEYDRWNASIAEAAFSRYKAEMPAYIDTDPEHLASWAAPLGVSSDAARDVLIAAIVPTLGLEGGARPLQRHADRFSTWRASLVATEGSRSRGARKQLDPPPTIALLAVLVLAAERMGADSSLAPNAYYPRLAEALGLDKAQENRLRQAFPITEKFWRGLNEYLESYEGSRGLPTAYALGHRYVGIPQSQAVVRAGDRAKLPEFFSRFGLAPGSEIIPADLETLLAAWIGAVPSPVSVNLQRLWKREASRERVAGVAAVELALWDGSTPRRGGETHPNDSEIRLLASPKQRFGSRTIEFSFTAKFAAPGDASVVRVTSAEGTPSISVMPAPGARLRPAGGTHLDAASLLGAVVEVEDPTTGERASRRPRRLVPFRKDELIGALVEVDRVQLAEDCMLLVKDDPQLVAGVTGVVNEFGHVGRVYGNSSSVESEPMSGLPEGWVLFDDVQIYGVPQNLKHMDLHCLIPLTSAQLAFAGGLKMPGNIRRWSRLRPPEIRAVAEGAETVRVTLSELGESTILLEDWTEKGPVLVRSLTELSLTDGNYEIQLFPNGETTPIASSTLRLRSADTPDLMSWETCSRLNYQLDAGAIAALTASPANDMSECMVDGLLAIGTGEGAPAYAGTPQGAYWAEAKASRDVILPTVVLGVPDPKSCVLTGAHRIELPPWLGGSHSGPLRGVCSTCGLTKTYPGNPKWKPTNFQARATSPQIEFRDLPSHPDLGASWDECLDAVVHVGGGSLGALERIAVQAESSSLFVDDFVRTLETLGHIDVRRDEHLQATEWEANPAFLAETLDGTFVLAGVWSSSTRRLLEAALSRVGGQVQVNDTGRGPSTRLVNGVSASTLEALVEDLGIGAYVVPDSVNRMLDVLPALSAIEDQLKKGPIPDFTKATLFDLPSASWVPTPGVGRPGAYRLEQSFRRVTIWVDHEGLLERTARGGGVQLVKHLAARHAKAPLTGFLEGATMLVVPLGADLPGLYGRVATLCSGRPPEISLKTRTLGYAGVPRSVADRITSLLQA